VRLELVPRPSFEGETIFRSDAKWSLLARGEERGFVHADGASAVPRYVARFRPGVAEVTIECSAALVAPAGGGRAIRSPLRYPLDQVLTMYALAGKGLLVHAAGLDRGGRGLAFPGVSGAGKSTFARLAGARPGWSPLSDDRVVVRVEPGDACLHGTPWAGSGRVAERRSVPAEGLLFLEKGASNEVRRISPAECLKRLLPVVSVPWFDRDVAGAGLETCERVARAVPAAVLTFRPDVGAVEAAERFLEGGAGLQR